MYVMYLHFCVFYVYDIDDGARDTWIHVLYLLYIFSIKNKMSKFGEIVLLVFVISPTRSYGPCMAWCPRG